MTFFASRWLLALTMVSLAQAQEGPAPAAAAAEKVVDAAPRIYIPVGDPNVRKVLLAIDRTQGGGSLANEFFETLQSNMDFTDFFELLPQDRFPSERGGMLPSTIKFDAYKAQGVEFLIKSTVSSSDKPTAELRLYDVNRGVQILGRQYPLISRAEQPGRELAHFAGNDIVQALTGEHGIFRTRLLMSCGKRTKEIYLMDFDGANVRMLTKDKNFALSPSWAPDGRRILFTSYKPAVRGGPLNPNLYMVDLISNVRRVISAAPGLNTGGVFAPDGNRIAYTFSRNGKAEIYIHDLASNTRRPVTKTHFFSVEPFWSPDGKRLVYSSSLTGRPHIYVSGSDGSNAQRLTFAGQYNSSPNWSPKGDRIAFAGQENMRNNFNIFLIDPNGSNLARLTDGSNSSENPSFSPDGRYIAFSSNKDGNYRIYVMTARGTRIRVLTSSSLGDCKQPAWSPRL